MRGRLVASVLVLTALALAGAPAAAQDSPVCGNGAIEPPETCDDGNVLPGDGCSELCALENLPPDCTAALASVDELWPPNHRLVPVGVLGVTDPDGDPVLMSITGVTQDEPLAGAGDGNTCPDATGVGTEAASVRAERSGQGDGRVYHVAFTAEDGRGGACAGEVLVCVRHDRRPGGTCADGGPVVDSTGALPPCEGESCGPEACAPDGGDLEPAECAGETPPAGVTTHVGRARSLLERAGQSRGRQARRLGARAARELGRAARRAERAARGQRLSGACADALGQRLESAGSCAMCATS